jgi:phosphoglycolate phosphatase-like HAD superfamily hydrolase
MPLEAILFDVDGTLVDSNDIHTRCWIEAFEHFGKALTWDEVRHQIGKGGDLLVPDLLSAREMQRFGDEVQEYRSTLFKERYLPLVKPFPGVKELFGVLRGRGVELALASSSDPEEVEYYTGLLGVGDLIEGSTSKKDAEFSKPSPEIFQAALERTGCDAVSALAVGDTPYDILSAHRAKVAVAAVLSGGFERELLRKAELLFDDVAEMVREIDRIDDYFSHE